MKSENLRSPRYRDLILMINKHPQIARAFVLLPPKVRKDIVVQMGVAQEEKGAIKSIAANLKNDPRTQKVIPTVTVEITPPRRQMRPRATVWEGTKRAETLRALAAFENGLSRRDLATLTDRSYNMLSIEMVDMKKRGLVVETRNNKTLPPEEGLLKVAPGIDLAKVIVPRGPKALPPAPTPPIQMETSSKTAESVTRIENLDILKAMPKGQTTKKRLRETLGVLCPGATDSQIEAKINSASFAGDIEFHGIYVWVGARKRDAMVEFYLKNTKDGNPLGKTQEISKATGLLPSMVTQAVKSLTLQGKFTNKKS